jgi:hypothetical protein
MPVKQQIEWWLPKTGPELGLIFSKKETQKKIIGSVSAWN